MWLGRFLSVNPLEIALATNKIAAQYPKPRQRKSRLPRGGMMRGAAGCLLECSIDRLMLLCSRGGGFPVHGEDVARVAFLDFGLPGKRLFCGLGWSEMLDRNFKGED